MTKPNSMLFLLFLLFLPSQPVEAQSWPAVWEAEITVGFDGRAERFDLVFPIYDENYIPTYWLICKGGSVAYLDKISSDAANYVGPLGCRLTLENEETDDSLLAWHEGLAVWHTRGRFFASQFQGACAQYPEYGRIRHFRLRGFVLTLEVTELEMNENRIQYMLLNVSVKNDETATSERAERPLYLNPVGPGRSCDDFKKREP